MLELKVGFVKVAFLTGTVNAYDAGRARGQEQRKEILDEAHADVIAE